MMRFCGVTAAGVELPLPPPISARLDMEEDAPADGFSGVFPLIGEAADFAGLRVYAEKLCFDGIIDEQTRQRSAAGQTLLLAARGREALLLDNEAAPAAHKLPSLPMMIEKHFAPYGFTEFRGPIKPFAVPMTVRKGMSEWAAVKGFCKSFLGVDIRMINGVLYAGEAPPRGFVRFGAGLPYASVSVVDDLFRAVSQLLVRAPGFSGYGGLLRNEEAAARGVRRSLCISEEYAGQAKERLEAARKRAFRIILTCPGGVCAALLDRAEVEDPAFGCFTGLTVRSVKYKLDSRGEFCTVELRKDDE